MNLGGTDFISFMYTEVRLLDYKVLFFFFNFHLLNAEIGLRCFVWASSSCGEQGLFSLQCTGFSLPWLLLLWSTGSGYMGFGSWSTQA